MHILFISGWYPYPPDNGSRIRVFNLIKQLSRRHEIDLLSFSEGPVSSQQLKKMDEYCRSVHTVQYKEFSPRGLKALLGFFSPRPRAVVDTYSREMHALVEQAGAHNSFDVAVASQLRSAPYARLLRQFPCVFEEIELQVARDRFLDQSDVVLRARYGLNWWKLSGYMARLLGHFQGATVVSELERDLVMDIVPSYDSLTIVPNGVDLEHYAGKYGMPKPDTLIYPGALTYSANFDAVEFFLNHVYPRVKAGRPGVTLRITGRNDGVPVDRLPLGNGCELTGYLDDVRPAIAQSWICVIPLRIGGGTRLKVLEAMALGTPVVSTTKGAEGLDVEPGRNILIADDPGELADAVLRVLNDRGLRTELAINGRRLVEERYSWETCAQELERLLSRVVERRGV